MGDRAAAVSKTQAPAKAAAKPARARRQPAERGAAASPALATVDAVLQDGGQPLDAQPRARMQTYFGHDFGAVRVHAGSAAAQSARALNARAYAVGRDIVFAAGEYRPEDPAADPLLAHELAHVVQQGARPYDAARALELEPPGSALEREADRAAASVADGAAAHVRPAAAATPQRVQRAEHGTYVSTLGSRTFTDAGAEFYKTWGHPNVRRVSNVKEILDDLDTAKGTLDRFRIVSHATSIHLELGLTPDVSPESFEASPRSPQHATRYTTEEGFREDFANFRIVSEATFKRVYDALWNDKSANALLVTLGGKKEAPKQTEPLGILLRSLVDERYLADVKLDDGKPPKIPNVGALQAFVDLRRTAYGKLVVAAKDKDKQADARKAIADLRAQIPSVMASAKITFNALTQDEANALAGPFVEGRGRLKRSLSGAIREGAGGPFVKKLQSVRRKIGPKTHIEIRGCNLGKSEQGMETVRKFFGQEPSLPSISAPDLYQYFYQVNVKSYSAREQADLEAAYTDEAVGVGIGFEELTRTKAGEMVRTAVSGKLKDPAAQPPAKDLAARYGFNADDVFKLNPEIGRIDAVLPAGTVLWLVQRDRVRAGRHTTLEDFCKLYLGKPYAWPKVWAANPGLTDPKALTPQDELVLPKDVLDQKFATMASMQTDFVSAVRGGEAAVGLASELDQWVRTARGVQKQRTTFDRPRPVLHVDDRKRNAALGKWLAAQRFDPKGRAAQVLADRFGKTGAAFEAARQRTYVQFLSRDYPQPVDPIFPDDPRYAKHIIRRP